MNRWIAAAALIAAVVLPDGAARAQDRRGEGQVQAHVDDRRVDDEAVLALLRARVAAGFGAAGLVRPGPGGSTLFNAGTGINADAALGVGHGLELGARLGARLDDYGRGLRADEVARGFETETFGTGVNRFANPELRLRWRAARRRWLEAGLDERLVLPTGPDPNVSEVFGAWISAHAPGVARADVGVDGALTWQRFDTGTRVIPALGVPIRLWLNVTRGLFVGGVATSRYDAPTPYTSSHLRTTLGAVGGYRFGLCDLMLGAYLIDVVNDGVDRSGLGLSLSCRIGRPPA
jgi:hypothetical protein